MLMVHDGVLLLLGGNKAAGRRRVRRINKKGEDKMRKYNSDGQIKTVVCNSCGKKIVVEGGIVREGMIAVDHTWDFFSEKDGEVHRMDLCENCYDDIISQFIIAVDIEEQVELL